MTQNGENKCGGCTMCCKLLGIEELSKPPSKWCSHCEIGKGCKVYEERPKSCVEFSCLWLNGFSDKPELRPDGLKVVFVTTPQANIIYALCDPGMPTAWESDACMAFITGLTNMGFSVVLGWGDGERKLLFSRGGPNVVAKKEITMSKPDSNGVQWYMPEGSVLHRDD